MPRGTETVTVIKTVIQDKLSTGSAADAGEFEIDGCQVIPRTSFEEGRGWVTIDGWDVWVLKNPPDEDVLSRYHVRVRGIVYAIEGTPGQFDKKQKFKGMRIVLKKVGSAK